MRSTTKFSGDDLRKMIKIRAVLSKLSREEEKLENSLISNNYGKDVDSDPALRRVIDRAETTVASWGARWRTSRATAKSWDGKSTGP